MTDQLEQAKFIEFSVNHMISPGVRRNWQKWFYRDGRKAYNVIVQQFATDHGLLYNARCQFVNETGTFNIEHFLDTENVADLIGFMSDVFDKLNCDPYDP